MNRQEYINAPSSTENFRAYYGQFINPGVKFAVLRVISREEILASRDPHFNDIPLHRWDWVFNTQGVPVEIAVKMRELGDYATLAGLVCIAKEAARQIKEEA